MNGHKSEIARLLAQMDAEYEAARRGLAGLASGTASHQFLIARCERIASLQDRLNEVIGDTNEAMRVLVQHQGQRG